MAMPLCYHPGLSKRKCEELLGRKAKDGAFLIRESETVKGALCLCVYKQKFVFTYRVVTSAGQFSVVAVDGVKPVFFQTLQELISHYRKRDQGLVIHLCFDVNREAGPLIRPPLPRDQVSCDQVPRDQVPRDQVSRDQVSRDQVSRDQVSRDQVSRDQVSSDQVFSEETTCNGTYHLCGSYTCCQTPRRVNLLLFPCKL
ncbi:hypothetical protein NHX12_021919 [Muraenolepis orangiensis]|uniref:SH2 domain-containing protein n=1 Tax=Muraenolepis orangiensis TaxID=630683 RepID=A0A9Q0IWF7_9TELE|nr:hypothetical protein NHX12_021919 [Muraenolepis orangiensis]